ncbi:transposase, partial [Suttonella ornithocola]|uniref:transposase n=1 Tax=Suttonella ornithocola TaxID=279832 RepID=UPI001B806427
DNAAFHKRSDIQAIIEEHGHEIVWLPPYSPDLNPIEKMWAWIKQIAKNGGWIVLILYSFICFGLGWVLDDCTIVKGEKIWLQFSAVVKIRVVV